MRVGRILNPIPLPTIIGSLAVFLPLVMWIVAYGTGAITFNKYLPHFLGMILVTIAFSSLSIARILPTTHPMIILSLNVLILSGALCIWLTGGPWGVGGWTYVAIAALFSFGLKTGLSIALVCCIPMGISAFSRFGGTASTTMGSMSIDYQILMCTFIFLVILATALNLQRNYRSLQKAQAMLSEVTAQQVRNQIMRDLHDYIGHSLVTTSVRMDLLEMLVQRQKYDTLQTVIRQVREETGAALLQIKSVVNGMDNVPLEEQVQHSVDLLKSAGLTVEKQIGNLSEIPENSQLAYATILQESVTNILRHSHANRVRITIKENRMAVEDNGVGFKKHNIPSIGMKGMRQRAEETGLYFWVGTSHALGGAMLEVTQDAKEVVR